MLITTQGEFYARWILKVSTNIEYDKLLDLSPGRDLITLLSRPPNQRKLEMSQVKCYQIYNTVIPSIGAGWRLVYADIKRKNVEIFYPADITFATVPMKVWHDMKPTAGKCNPTRYLKHINSYAKLMGVKSKKLNRMKRLIKEAA